MQRAAVDPRGRRWIVHIQWLGRRIGRDTLLARFARRRSERRVHKTRNRARKNGWADALDGGDGCLDLADAPWALAAVVVVALLIWLGPGALALLLGLSELLFVVVAAAFVFAWRTAT